MKKMRVFSMAMAIVIFMAAVMPATPAAAREIESATSDNLNVIVVPSAAASLPEVTMWVESNNGSYGCTLIKQSPGDWIDMKPRQGFDVTWTVRNTGGAVWHASATKFAYVGGTKMQTHGDQFTLSQDVGRGGKMSFTVDMEAPKTPGVYSTLWAVYSGNTRFCKVTLTLSVTR